MPQVITQGETDLLTAAGIHEPLMKGPWDFDIYLGQFPAVRGETHITGKNKGRDLMVQVRYRGFESYGQLETAMAELEELQGLDGDLTIDDAEFVNCTFVRAQQVEPAFPDGSGINGWSVKYLLQWRQRGPDPPEEEPDP